MNLMPLKRFMCSFRSIQILTLIPYFSFHVSFPCTGNPLMKLFFSTVSIPCWKCNVLSKNSHSGFPENRFGLLRERRWADSNSRFHIRPNVKVFSIVAHYELTPEASCLLRKANMEKQYGKSHKNVKVFLYVRSLRVNTWLFVITAESECGKTIQKTTPRFCKGSRNCKCLFHGRRLWINTRLSVFNTKGHYGKRQYKVESPQSSTQKNQNAHAPFFVMSRALIVTAWSCEPCGRDTTGHSFSRIILSSWSWIWVKRYQIAQKQTNIITNIIGSLSRP